MAHGGGGPLDQVLGPIPGANDVGGPPWLEMRGPEGGSGMQPGSWPRAPGTFSCSVRWRALTIPTGMEPAIKGVINLILCLLGATSSRHICSPGIVVLTGRDALAEISLALSIPDRYYVWNGLSNLLPGSGR